MKITINLGEIIKLVLLSVIAAITYGISLKLTELFFLLGG
jgi:hypothetical protein